MKTKDTILKKGTKVFTSKYGHYNFCYPDEGNSLVLSEDLSAKFLPYVSGKTSTTYKKLTAFKVKDIITNISNKYAVIWAWI